MREFVLCALKNLIPPNGWLPLELMDSELARLPCENLSELNFVKFVARQPDMS